jgi:hypothetical protein
MTMAALRAGTSEDGGALHCRAGVTRALT